MDPPATLATSLSRLSRWSYAKQPFAGPEAVLAYLSRYTHRIAISNRRLVAADAATVAFKYKDYRVDGPGRFKVMTLATGEFIRRFLSHVLPKGFHRIRHYGLLANGGRTANVAKARELLSVPVPVAEPAPERAGARRRRCTPGSSTPLSVLWRPDACHRGLRARPIAAPRAHGTSDQDRHVMSTCWRIALPSADCMSWLIARVDDARTQFAVSPHRRRPSRSNRPAHAADRQDHRAARRGKRHLPPPSRTAPSSIAKPETP